MKHECATRIALRDVAKWELTPKEVRELLSAVFEWYCTRLETDGQGSFDSVLAMQAAEAALAHVTYLTVRKIVDNDTANSGL